MPAHSNLSFAMLLVTEPMRTILYNGLFEIWFGIDWEPREDEHGLALKHNLKLKNSFLSEFYQLIPSQVAESRWLKKTFLSYARGCNKMNMSRFINPYWVG